VADYYPVYNGHDLRLQPLMQSGSFPGYVSLVDKACPGGGAFPV